MALPNKIDKTVPAGSRLRSLGDDDIRDFKLAVQDILGLPDNTNISAALFEIVAAGLKSIYMQDAAADPTVAGQIRRNGARAKWHDGSIVQSLAFLTDVSPGLNSIQIFTASGTWTRPAGVLKVIAEVVGGGGGSGG